jgi:hypothetical protein
MLQGTLRLCSPQLVARHVNFSEAVGFFPNILFVHETGSIHGFLLLGNSSFVDGEVLIVSEVLRTIIRRTSLLVQIRTCRQVDDGLREGVRGLLRNVVANPACDKPELTLFRKLIAIRRAAIVIVGTAIAGSATSRFSRSSYFRSPSARPSRQR